MNTKPEVIPTGLDHLAVVRAGGMYAATQTAEHLGDFKINNDLIGTAMNVLYQAGTCHRKCYGGSHTFRAPIGESL